MKIKKSDFALIKEAEKNGLMVSMDNIVHPIRTELNNTLSNYFREKMPSYNGIFDEDTSEDILYSLNTYIKENEINKHPLSFPLSSGTSVHLTPINENINLKILIVDEYYGDGDYSKYIDITYFVITENTTKKDVDDLIEFTTKNILI